MFVLNREILMNSKNDIKSLSLDIFHYMKQQSIARFNPLVHRKELTFLKHCRLVDVRFRPEGIETTGYLWQLRKKIHPQRCQHQTRLLLPLCYVPLFVPVV
jgi:hypothetical protein